MAKKAAYGSKKKFIVEALAKGMKVAAIVAAAKAQGLALTPHNVYDVRSYESRKAVRSTAAKRSKRVAVRRSKRATRGQTSLDALVAGFVASLRSVLRDEVLADLREHLG